MIRSTMLLRAGIAGLCVLAFAPGSRADAPAAFGIGATRANPAATTSPASLAALPATAEQLTFTGESGSRQFAVTVLADETAQPAKLVLALESAVSVMPETSLLRVFVNDQPAGETHLGTGETDLLSLDLAPGLLVPGLNQIRIVLDQHHRVDCSIAGTYELWTAIDPEKSGLSFPNGPSKVATLDDLPALSRLFGGGVTTIRGTLPKGTTAKDTERMLGLVQSVVLKGGFPSPKLSVDGPATGVALDIALGSPAASGGSTGNTSLPFVAFEPSSPAGPARLVVTGATGAELDRNLADFAMQARQTAMTGSEAGQRASRQARGIDLTSGSSATLGDLGMESRPFAGRFFRDSVAFRLPSDFYPADYADASLSLNAGYAAGLSSGAQLIVRANGLVVATIPLSSSKRGLIENQRLRLPLGTLRPGTNVLSFEANLPNASDAACDPAEQASPATRFLLSDTSVLTLPDLARVGHVPDLSTTISGGGKGRDHDLTVYLPKLDPARLATAGTFIAKLAASADTYFRPDVVTTMPFDETRHLIGFGSYSELPPELLSAVRLAVPGQNLGDAEAPSLLVGQAKAAGIVAPWQTVFGAKEEDAAGLEPAAGAAPEAAGGFAAALPTAGALMEGVGDLGSRLTDGLLALTGFGGEASKDLTSTRLFQPGKDTRLVIAQGAAPIAKSGAWTVVAAADAATLDAGVDLLTRSDRWAAIGGAVSTLEGSDAALRSIAAGEERLYETQPFSLFNTRLVVAGWFSRHFESYAVALLVACLFLGVSTFLLLRNIGEGRR
ncbi:hypothetical protein ASG43_20975 [Aureimonas sp. Leaf454]|uniref:cellulose biosynthesis cyclic di-GMP-binding regulatory protein BcsB n=1 Tax=Aureimonas sp. Leaf454 TaxID=1736381 RepID=UPI0006F8EE80|nr:cellulose biosynthesis cyclic di-GMP-binding regulatory protein BcsB [Aureimonas sp. Leaf454]KQT51966.1 hypothetical protein ASG43_20975 [Aureimonas sp. Leaf454]